MTISMSRTMGIQQHGTLSDNTVFLIDLCCFVLLACWFYLKVES